MILVFCAESIYTDLVRFPFVSVEQQVVPHFLLLALILCPLISTKSMR